MKLWHRPRPSGQDGRTRDDDEVRSIERQWGVETCTFCGRTLVLGEPVRHVRYQGARASACPECFESFVHGRRLDRAA